jgi:hypothetical protein
MLKLISTGLLFVSLATQAQVLIPKFGMTVSSLRADQYVTDMDNSFGSRKGFTAGVGYAIRAGRIGNGFLYVQPEINFVQKGFQVDATGEFEFEGVYQLESKQSYRLNYLDMPVLAKYTWGGSNLKVSVTAGPAASFALGGQYTAKLTKTQDGITEILADTKGDVVFYDSNEPNTMSFDYNIALDLQAGLGITIKEYVYLEARGISSLTNLNHNNKTKNQLLQFTVGVPITLK